MKSRNQMKSRYIFFTKCKLKMLVRWLFKLCFKYIKVFQWSVRFLLYNKVNTTLASEEERLQKNITELTERCNQAVIKRHRLRHINRQLEDLIRQCSAFEDLPSIPSMHPSKTFGPNEKLDLQPKFYRTRKENKTKEEKKTFNREEVVKMLTKTPKKKQIIPRLSAKPEDVMIKYGNNQDQKLFYSSFLSLEIYFDKQERSPRSRIGWLCYEIIDAYLYNLCKVFHRTTYIGCVESWSLMLNRSSIHYLLSGTDLGNIDLVFIPCNHSQV